MPRTRKPKAPKVKATKRAHDEDKVGLDESGEELLGVGAAGTPGADKPGSPRNVRQIPARGRFDSPFIPATPGKTGVVRAGPAPTRTAASRRTSEDRGAGGRFLLLEGDFEDAEGNVWSFQKGVNTILELDFDAVKLFPNKFKRIGADGMEVLDESQPTLPTGPVPVSQTDREEEADEEEDDED